MEKRNRSLSLDRPPPLMTTNASQKSNEPYSRRRTFRRRALIAWRSALRKNRTVLAPIRVVYKSIYEHVVPNLSDFMEARTLLLWSLSVVIGVVVAYAALMFRMAIGVIQMPWLGTMSERVYEAAAHLPWFILLLAPMTGGLIVGLFLHFFMPGKRAQAVADVIEAKALKDGFISLRTGLSSAFVSLISLGAGASAGREGPVVHLGASLASSAQTLFSLPRAGRRTILGCGVAAAVSASFNAPFAAVLFAHEVILGHYAMRAFVPITISSVVASVIAHTHVGNFPTFQIPNYAIQSYFEFPAFAALGVVCAVVAVLFQLCVMFADRTARLVEIPLWIRPVLGGLLVGLIALMFPQVLGVGYGATDAALHGQFSLGLLISLILAKTLATAITLASRFGGGVFSPALYIGAMTGGAFGIIAASIFPDLASDPGAYALIGMGAVAATVLGAPISTGLIVFELTGGYALTIALLLAISISYGLAQAVHGVSFFHWQLRSRGLYLDQGPHRLIVRSIRVSEFMTPLSEEETAKPVSIEADDPWLSKDHVVETALRMFDQTGAEKLPVLNGDDGTGEVIGWARHVDALDVVNRALIDAHVEEHK